MNYTDICRICLRLPQQSKYLFEEESNLVHKIEVISSILIKETDDLPKKVCEECLSNINTFYSFRKVIINTDHDLRTRLETLKRTNFLTKPKSKKKATKIKHYIQSENTSDIKPADDDLDLQHDTADDNEDDNDSENDQDQEDCTVTRKLSLHKIYRCRQCKKIFDSRFKLYNHKRTDHNRRGVCNICGTIIRSDNLKKHIKMHSEDPIQCDVCQKVFKNSGSLRSHKLLHLDVRFTCEICGRTFKMKSEHNRHIKKHEDPDYRKIECNICGKKVHEIKKHMISHTGVKPYTCAYCQKLFSSRYALKVHSRQHTNEKPYKCDLCGHAFPQKVSLVTHMMSKHGVENNGDANSKPYNEGDVSSSVCITNTLADIV